MTYSEKEYKRKLSLGQTNNALITLIAIHLLMFVIFGFVKMVYYFIYQDTNVALNLFNKNVSDWFILPADETRLL